MAWWIVGDRHLRLLPQLPEPGDDPIGEADDLIAVARTMLARRGGVLHLIVCDVDGNELPDPRASTARWFVVRAQVTFARRAVHLFRTTNQRVLVGLSDEVDRDQFLGSLYDRRTAESEAVIDLLRQIPAEAVR